jgi:hypothetical protein
MGQFTSEVSVANLALGWLGLDPIISLDDPTNSAALCKQNLAPLRDALLESSDWTFAQKRAELAPSASVPPWGYAYQFEIPIDCLRICYVTDSPDIYESMPMQQWVKEGRCILTNSASCFIRYSSSIEDPKMWSEGFGQSLAARLAIDICMPTTDSTTFMQAMQALFAEKLETAKTNDTRQGTQQRIISNALTRVRN